MPVPPHVDPLSEILTDLKLDSAFFFNAEFAPPWCVHSPPSRDYAPHLSPRAGHLIIFHMLTAGSMYAGLDRDTDRVSLSPGEVIAFPHGDAHVLGSGAGVHQIEAGDALAHVRRRGLELARFGSGKDSTRVVCGFMALDSQLGPAVLAGLPPMLRVSLRQDPSGHWLENSIRFSVTQAAASGDGSRAVLARLAETLFLEVIRRYIQQSPEAVSGWLAALRDPALATALSLLHNRSSEPWTLAALARESGLSRSVLAERFKSCLGYSPMAYLTRRRLQLAARLLAAQQMSVAEISAASGYESEPAFHRAFKREFGVPPVRYRTGLSKPQETER
ncbi:MAG: AraC family transcriptional regulator [Acidobacteria bacterium]|nr:AraC family transcriptional regulator [Acidobacteriota bacterium]